MKYIIKKYNIRIKGEQLACDPFIKRNAEDLEFVKAHKSEIIEFIKKAEENAKKEKEDRKAKIKNIVGLAEIKNAISEYESYKEELDNFVLSGATGKAPIKPSADIEAMKRTHPRAAAYLYAEEYSYAAHFIKANAGREALEKIINGEPFEEAIANMEKIWSNYCAEHTMD